MMNKEQKWIEKHPITWLLMQKIGGVSVVLCQVLCLYAFVVGDTPLIDTLRPSMV